VTKLPDKSVDPEIPAAGFARLCVVGHLQR
jgi:hypothetical protein